MVIHRKMVTAFLCILFCIMMVLSACTTIPGGTGNTPEQATKGTETAGGTTNSDSGEAKAYPQFTLWIGTDEKKSPEITEVQKLFKEKLGFDFKVQSRQGDLMTALNLKLNSGGFEDVAVIYKDDVAINAFVKSGLIQEVSQYFNMPDKYPNLAKIPQEVVSFCQTTDGKSWYIPGWYAQEMNDPWPGWVAAAWWPRMDLVQKVGMTADDISTIDGLENT